MHHRHSRPTTLKGLMAVCVVLAGLTACSNDPTPIIEPAPSQTPTADPPDSPTTTPTPEPEPAKAFIRRWQDETFAMQNSGETSNYLAMTDDCTSCAALVAEVKKIYEGGGSVRTAGGKVSAIERVGNVDEVAIYEYQVISEPSQVLDSDGDVTSDFVGGRSRFQINLSRKQGSWLVLRVSRLAS